MQSWSRAREVEKLKPVTTKKVIYVQTDPLVAMLDSMDRWLSNSHGLTIDEVIEWREHIAKLLGVPEQSWFERTGKVPE